MALRIVSVVVLLITGFCVIGCVSKTAADAQARAAYLAGKRDAIAEMNRQSGGTNSVGEVSFIGPVENSTVPWSEGLTLGKAILTAVYSSPTDPTMIVIMRPNEQLQIDPARLLDGNDYPLLPGDIIRFIVPQRQ